AACRRALRLSRRGVGLALFLLLGRTFSSSRGRKVLVRSSRYDSEVLSLSRSVSSLSRWSFSPSLRSSSAAVIARASAWEFAGIFPSVFSLAVIASRVYLRTWLRLVVTSSMVLSVWLIRPSCSSVPQPTTPSRQAPRSQVAARVHPVLIRISLTSSGGFGCR